MLNNLILQESKNLTTCPKVRKLKDCDKEGPTEARPGCWSPGTTGNINLFATGFLHTVWGSEIDPFYSNLNLDFCGYWVPQHHRKNRGYTCM